MRKGYIATKAGMVEAESGILETSDPDIRVPVAELLDSLTKVTPSVRPSVKLSPCPLQQLSRPIRAKKFAGN